MTSTTARPPHRTLRVLADIVLRSAALAGCVAAVPVLSGENDALALGLSVFFFLAALAFGLGVLDGMFQRDRRRLVTVWVAVVPLTALLITADYLRGLLTEPGAFPSIAQGWAEMRGDIPSSLVLYAVLVGLPAVAGIGLGMLIRPVAAAAPRGMDEAAPSGSLGGVR